METETRETREQKGPGLISLAQVVADRRTIPVEFAEGVKLAVTYRPSLLTSARVGAIRQAKASPDVEDVENLRLSLEVIQAWDLGGPLFDLAGREIVPAGEAVPVDVAFAAHLPTEVIGAILGAIADDVAGGQGAPKGKRSRA